ncbi:hypothetical protein EWM64_g8315 [Hericium alpestre]|uniref:Protein kinase domain-containing protein n=1 Tax=Hericium alpestre TaxID=135208 RepID=A0A4Y9ZQC8_9AGAM|nr:hypothetical protein EWM64_g8315 [Hericium alpestre]
MEAYREPYEAAYDPMPQPVINILNHSFDEQRSIQSFWMPYIPNPLATLLACPVFAPWSYRDISPQALAEQVDAFHVLSKSFIYQIISAIAYLHEAGRGIANRDLKPGNILFTDDGCIKLIDFGIAFREADTDEDRKHDIWPECPRKMYFEVGTGSYRAPELLFGPSSYDALAADRWSLGATLAEFFTTLRRRSLSDDGDDGDWGSDENERGSEDLTQPFILDTPKSEWSTVRWERCSLFDSSRGDLGLIWSIFKTRGTPTSENWPTFGDLPDATKISFAEVPGIDFASILPNLSLPPPPPQGRRISERSQLSHLPPADAVPTPQDLVHRFLVYPQSSRLTADAALKHPWFTSDVPLLLPPEVTSRGAAPSVSETWKGKSLEGWLQVIMSAREDEK